MINTIFKKTNFQIEDKLVPIDIKSIEYIKNKIININCVLITEELFNLISSNNKNNKNIILYEVQGDSLTLFFKKSEKLELKHYKLLLDNKSINRDEPGYDEINNILEKMRNYNTSENNVVKYLLDKKVNNGDCGLVKKSVIDDFKKFSDYEYFKNNYFHDNNNYIPRDIKKEIFNEIIEYREQNKSKKFSNWKNKIIITDNKDELKTIIKNEPLVLIDNKNNNVKKIFSNLNEDDNYKLFDYIIYDGKISIKFKGEEPLMFKCKDNIISYNNIIYNDNSKKFEEIDYLNQNKEIKNKNLIKETNKLNKNNLISQFNYL